MSLASKKTVALFFFLFSSLPVLAGDLCETVLNTYGQKIRPALQDALSFRNTPKFAEIVAVALVEGEPASALEHLVQNAQLSDLAIFPATKKSAFVVALGHRTQILRILGSLSAENLKLKWADLGTRFPSDRPLAESAAFLGNQKLSLKVRKALLQANVVHRALLTTDRPSVAEALSLLKQLTNEWADQGIETKVLWPQALTASVSGTSQSWRSLLARKEAIPKGAILNFVDPSLVSKMNAANGGKIFDGRRPEHSLDPHPTHKRLHPPPMH